MLEEDFDMPALFVDICRQRSLPFSIIGQKMVLIASGAIPKVDQA